MEGEVRAAGQPGIDYLRPAHRLEARRFGTDIVGAGQFNASFSLSGSPVPEPSTWAMMLLGFAGLGFAGYRRARMARPASA